MNRTQPEVRGNDWRTLQVAELDGFRGTRSVSVVIPYYDDAATLPLVLAGLAAQDYPAERFEVIVVNDDSEAPLTLPELRPANCRVLTNGDDWGQSAARRTAVAASDGEILCWIDADVIPPAHWIRAHARWHHLIDYAVVTGEVVFVDAATADLDPTELHDLLRRGDHAALEARVTSDHQFVTAFHHKTGDLTRAGEMPFWTNVTANSSVSRGLYARSGPERTSLRRGDDTELAYRLWQAGGVFVPDATTHAWHVGPSAMMVNREAMRRHHRIVLNQYIPTIETRPMTHRAYRVPLLDVTVAIGDAPSYERVVATVDALLADTVSDLGVTIVGDFPEADEPRHDVLDAAEPLRLLLATYAHVDRVRCVNSVDDRWCSPSPYRLTVEVGDVLPRGALGAALATIRDRSLATVLIPRRGGSPWRVERVSAFERAARLASTPAEAAALAESLDGAATVDLPSRSARCTAAVGAALRRWLPPAVKRPLKRLLRR